MTRIVRGLSVFCESFSKYTFSFSYVLFLTSFAFFHINQVRSLARHLLFDFSYFPSVVKCVVCSFVINVWAIETSMFGVGMTLILLEPIKFILLIHKAETRFSIDWFSHLAFPIVS